MSDSVNAAGRSATRWKGLRFYGVAEKKTRQLAGATLGAQSIGVFLGGLVAWSLTRMHSETLPTLWLWFGVALAVACIVAAGSLRRPGGITLGWVLQAASVVIAIAVPAMAWVAGIFLLLWVTALVQGAKMDALTAQWLADNPDPDSLSDSDVAVGDKS